MEDCLFCKIVKNEIDSKVIYEDDLVMAVLDAYPNVSGHTLIIPKKHYTTFNDIDDDLLLHINKVAKDLSKMLMDKFNAKSITLLVNYGDSQVIKHYHLHLLPNYGDPKKPAMERDEAYKIIKGE